MRKLSRIISFSVPEDYEFVEELMRMTSKEFREAMEEGLKVLKGREKGEERI